MNPNTPVATPLEIPTGKTAPVGTAGELCPRGYHVIKGYYQNSEATQAVIEEDGWLHQGDLAVPRHEGISRLPAAPKT